MLLYNVLVKTFRIYRYSYRKRWIYQSKQRIFFYKVSSNEIGPRCNEAPKEKKYISDRSFTKHIMYTGMYKYSGLNCSSDKERVINGSKDWILNL